MRSASSSSTGSLNLSLESSVAALRFSLRCLRLLSSIRMTLGWWSANGTDASAPNALDKTIAVDLRSRTPIRPRAFSELALLTTVSASSFVACATKYGTENILPPACIMRSVKSASLAYSGSVVSKPPVRWMMRRENTARNGCGAATYRNGAFSSISTKPEPLAAGFNK